MRKRFLSVFRSFQSKERCLITTIRDVAERAGVSISTVSHILNETRHVSDELKERVQLAMLELNYKPNALARSLRRKRSRTLGIIVPDSANPYFAEVARGVEDASFDQGYSVILCNSDADPEKESMYINVLAEKQVDGICLVAASSQTIETHLDNVPHLQIPMVLIDRENPNTVVDSVVVENTAGSIKAVEHLLSLGHQRIGCITGLPDLINSQKRSNGYREALKNAGLIVDESLIVEGDFRYEGGYDATKHLLGLNDPPTAIFACNDLMAIGAISAIVSAGLSVPQDISIVGFDDIHLAMFANPPLTTVVQPKYEMGVTAAKILLQRLQTPDLPPKRHLLQTHLLVRESTKAVVHHPIEQNRT
ncbi:MAG: LacI family DNA-binding transcriptional regulator [Ardenticatenaceae bacterium]|nr:LacI family DNA-binding transcriptional regulator [Ardenticatenaceae bacterium]